MFLERNVRRKWTDVQAIIQGLKRVRIVGVRSKVMEGRERSGVVFC